MSAHFDGFRKNSDGCWSLYVVQYRVTSEVGTELLNMIIIPLVPLQLLLKQAVLSILGLFSGTISITFVICIASKYKAK
jgi:hypothetical protein